MYTREQIEKFFSDNGWQLISILSEPRKNKYNRDVKIVAKCCIHGCDKTVTKSLHNFMQSRNAGCEIHCEGIKVQKMKETKEQNKKEKAQVQEEEEDTQEQSAEEETKEQEQGTEEEKGQEEEKENANTIELTEDLKAQFLKEHYFFNYKGQVWTKANNVGRFFQFKDARHMIYHHVLEFSRKHTKSDYCWSQCFDKNPG